MSFYILISWGGLNQRLRDEEAGRENTEKTKNDEKNENFRLFSLFSLFFVFSVFSPRHRLNARPQNPAGSGKLKTED
jgi:hypothetical protein